MSWHTPSLMSSRLEFVSLAAQPGISFRQLCARFQISPKTGYKWRARYDPADPSTLQDRSRRPQRSPTQSSAAVAHQVLALYQESGWGGRKLRLGLRDRGVTPVPAASTCTAILRRHGVYAARTEPTRPFQRFCREHPNALWQMDFKGDFPMQDGRRCHPLSALDDHSRFNLFLVPCSNQTGATVRTALEDALRHYGLPDQILCDNGAPWGSAEPICPYTTFTVWLLRLGVRVLHGRPYHPQTQGKQERFHRTLKRELLSRHTWRDLTHCTREFQAYRERYNCQRPHQSLADDKPVEHYRPSVRAMPASLPAIEYPVGTDVRILRPAGFLTFGQQTWYVGRAFAGLPIGLRPSPQADGQWQVCFDHHPLGTIDLTSPRQPKHALRSIYTNP